VHYNWHWFWHWGTSEVGNNGVHTIDYDVTEKQIVDDSEAMKLWARQYEDGWKPSF